MKFFILFALTCGLAPTMVWANRPTNTRAKQNTLAPQPGHTKKLKAEGLSRRTQGKRSIHLGKKVVTKAPKKEVRVIMQDPLMNDKWDLDKISAEQAWLYFSKGSRDIVVAVVDTGMDIKHPDLKANVWKNPKEIPGNNKDDDGNGYVDDIHGWNFVHNNNNVSDSHGHGTHIAGIIGAVGGNKVGLSGVAPKVSLMILKYFSPKLSGKKNMINTTKAIEYAVANGAHIINYSGGGPKPNKKELSAIRKAEKKGILFVSAAGNEGNNIDKKVSYYPARYPLSNILPVTATDIYDQVLRSSNYGKTVHKSAPGRNILSTLPGGKYGLMTGTSQATAVATGAAVLIMDYYKSKTSRFVIKHLTMTGDINHKLQGKTSQSRRLNIFKALQARGKTVSFMDQEVVDPLGKKFYFDKEISSATKPLLQQEQQEIDMLSQIMGQAGQAGESAFPEPARQQLRQNASVTEPEVLEEDRSPSSSEKAKKPFLKRWFWK